MTNRAQTKSFRQSVMIDTQRYPELAYMKDLTGWGMRAAELIRLARLGAICEQQQQELLAQFSSVAQMQALARANQINAKDMPAFGQIQSQGPAQPCTKPVNQNPPGQVSTESPIPKRALIADKAPEYKRAPTPSTSNTDKVVADDSRLIVDKFVL